MALIRNIFFFVKGTALTFHDMITEHAQQMLHAQEQARRENVFIKMFKFIES